MKSKSLRGLVSLTTALGFAALAPNGLWARPNSDADLYTTKTPIKHVVVIFQENVSFDHYFGTYPHALNPAGEPAFEGKEDTPRVNNLETAGLLTNNPNGADPVRIDRSVPNTCDQDHNYGDEQFFFDGGLMDRFLAKSCVDKNLGKTSILDYYDGNTVTALWNYAQRFAMSDNHFGTTFGPSTPGALNVVSGQTYAGSVTNGLSGAGFIANGASFGAVIGDADPGGGRLLVENQNTGDHVRQEHRRSAERRGPHLGGFHGGVRELHRRACPRHKSHGTDH